MLEFNLRCCVKSILHAATKCDCLLIIEVSLLHNNKLLMKQPEDKNIYLIV